MRIAFLTSGDARQPAAWSGTPYYMARALSRLGTVSYMGPIRSVVEATGRVRNRLSNLFLGRRHTYEHTFALAKEYASRFRRRIPPDVDLLVVPAGSTQTAFLETDVPILYTSDATFALLRDYFPRFTNLPMDYVRQAHEIERLALRKATFAVYPSEWAAHSARSDYNVPAERVHVIPYGANLDEVPSREVVLAAKRDVDLRLLFLGVGWERKGGPIAFATTSLLRESGLDARLIVCGCVPPARYRAPWMESIPRLDKRNPAEAARLRELFLQAAFLFVPSRYESFGIVYCEASAHGTPSIATDTGGVSGAVRHGENGLLISKDAGPESIAGLIAEAFRDRDRYLQLAASSRTAYEQRLNWGSWVRSVARLLRAAGFDAASDLGADSAAIPEQGLAHSGGSYGKSGPG